jgi:hypothetical protein
MPERLDLLDTVEPLGIPSSLVDRRFTQHRVVGV